MTVLRAAGWAVGSVTVPPARALRGVAGSPSSERNGLAPKFLSDCGAHLPNANPNRIGDAALVAELPILARRRDRAEQVRRGHTRREAQQRSTRRQKRPMCWTSFVSVPRRSFRLGATLYLAPTPAFPDRSPCARYRRKSHWLVSFLGRLGG